MKLLYLLLLFTGWVVQTGLAQPLGLRDSVTYWDKAGEFHKALDVSLRWQIKAAKETGTESAEYADALYQVGLFQYELRMLEEALKSVRQVLDLRNRINRKPVLEMAKAQNLLGIIFKQKGNLTEALYWYKEADRTMVAAGEENNPFYGSVLNNLGTVLFAESKYDEALAIYHRALEAYKKTTDPTDLRFLWPKTNIAGIQVKRGNYEAAITGFRDILEERAKRGLQNHPDNGFVLDGLIRLEIQLGKFAAAEAHVHDLLRIHKHNTGENNTAYAAALNLQADYYIEMGNYEKAEPVTRQVLHILEKQKLDTTNEYSNALINMGRISTSHGQHQESLQYYQRSSDIYLRLEGPKSDNYLVSLNNIGTELDQLGNYRAAETAYKKALKGLEGNSFVNQLQSLYEMNLAAIYRKTGRFKEAEATLSGAIGRYEKLRLTEINHYFLAESNMAQLFLDMGKADRAESWFRKLNQHQLGRIQKYFPGFSETEKEKFYAKLVTDFSMFNSFCQLRAAANPAILDEMNNNQLAMKALLLNSSAKWKQRIKSSHDRKLLLKFTEWEEYRNRLNRLYQSTDSTEKAGIDSLEEKSGRLEKELSQRSEHFAELADKRSYTWKDVQAKLKPGEATIEMVRLNKYGVYRTVTDTSNPTRPVYKEKGMTDTVFYAALLVKPGMPHPEMILLKNGKELEGKFLNQYKNLIRSKSLDDKSYAQFWKQIGEKVKDCNRIYLSPDGVYHQINLSTLFNPATKKFLLEEKDIRLVTVTKDLLIPKREETENKLAYLFGRPNYYHTANEPVLLASTDRKSPVLEYRLDMDSTHLLADLPGTEKEVNQVETLLAAKTWEIHNFRGERALEENLKESYKPRLLHIATHGYFQTDTLRNPLLRSGLMLAGAGPTLQGQKNDTGEDGILTAYEAMNLNLDNTDLVVLSACETGLGEIKNGEGVYGLQRAFKVAGARSIVMSLWKVDDTATQELMVGFYKYWLAGLSKRAAFLKAQKELKTKYPNPYYWGAFVMVGE